MSEILNRGYKATGCPLGGHGRRNECIFISRPEILKLLSRNHGQGGHDSEKVENHWSYR